jgi:AcrR family transcriptional regulator
MGRPRRNSDEELLDRIDAVLTERPSFEPWGLGDVSPAAGISPAGLIKRFGSKEGLLQALAQRWVDTIPDAPAAPGRGLPELRTYVEENFAAAPSSAAIFGLGELLRDLRSPSLAALLRQGWTKQAAYFESLLGRVPLQDGVDPHTAALTLLDALHGSLYRQAVSLEPTNPTRTLDNLLEGWT